MFLGDIPAATLWKQLIDTREVLAGLRNSHNIYDAFVVPAGLVRTSDGPDGGNTGNVLASKITAEILNFPFTSIHNVKRAQWNAALAAMNQAISQLQSPTGITTNVAPTIPAVTTVDTSSPVTTAPSPVTNQISPATASIIPTSLFSGGNTMLYLLGGLGIFFLMRNNQGPAPRARALRSAPRRKGIKKGKRHASK